MKIIVSLLLLTAMYGAKAQQPDSVRIFVDSALGVMERHSVFASKLNWQRTRDTVRALTKNAQTFKQAAPGIRYAFDALGDKHGWLAFGDEQYRNSNFRPDTTRINANMKAAALKGARIYAGIVEKEFAYISIPFFGGQTPEAMAKFAQRIQDSLVNVINEKTKGIIIDLRLNAGGNVFPMYAGLSNVLGQTDLSIAPSANGDDIERTTITKNGIEAGGKIIVTLPRTWGDLSAHPVVVLTGPVTGSAGECLAAAFIGRENTVLVGEATAGYTTANEGFLLYGKDHGLVLAVGYLTDRYGNVYPDDVKPDVTVIGGDDFFNRENDKKIRAAINWINAQQPGKVAKKNE